MQTISMEQQIKNLEQQVSSLQLRLDTLQKNNPANRAVFCCFSSDLDKILPAFMLATGAAAMDMQVSMFFSFWSTAVLKKKSIYAGKSLIKKMITLMTPSGPQNVGTSKLNMLGMGPVIFKGLMKKHNVATLPDLITLAQDLGVKLIACEMTMSLMGIKKEELIDNVTFAGAASFLNVATGSTLFTFT